jgi:SAM-dependent methyltransferase
MLDVDGDKEPRLSPYFASFRFEKLDREIRWQIRNYTRFPWLLHKYRLLSHLPQEARLLDIGCGFGDCIRIVKNIRPDISLYGLDRDDGLIYVQHSELTFRLCDFVKEGIPFSDGLFDLVYCSHVLEHIENPIMLLREIYRVLRKGGILYCEAPDIRSAIIPHVPGVASEGMFNFWDDPTHKRPWTRISLQAACRMAGFTRNVTSFYVRDWLLMLTIPRSLIWFVFRRHNKHATNIMAPILGFFVACVCRK